MYVAENMSWSSGGGRIRYVTLAPEVEGVMDLIRHIRKNHRRIVISMGHSSAEYETAVQAVEEGVTSATHLFNAMKLFHMHRPAISGAALERDEVMCEIIADGFHLHPATIRLIAKTKGWNRIVAASDSIMATGLPAGSYKLGEILLIRCLSSHSYQGFCMRQSDRSP